MRAEVVEYKVKSTYRLAESTLQGNTRPSEGCVVMQESIPVLEKTNNPKTSNPNGMTLQCERFKMQPEGSVSCKVSCKKVRCNPRTTCKVKLLAQAYSIRECVDRRLLTKEGGIRRPVTALFSPSGGGQTS